MTATVSSTAKAAAIAAADGAANGAKNAAYLGSLRTSIGTNFVVILTRDGSTVYTGTATGLLVISGDTFALPTSLGSITVTPADIDTGVWKIRVHKAGDTTIYIESDVTLTGGAGPFFLSADLATTLTLSALTFSSPAFDTIAASGDSVETVIADMGNENDAIAAGVDSYPSQPRYIWNADPALTDATPGFVGFGNRWRLDEQASYITNNTSIPAQYRTYPGSQCKYTDLWYVLLDGPGHSANNTRVRVENVSFKARLRSNNSWVTLASQVGSGQFYASKSSIQSISGDPDVRTIGGEPEILVPAGVWNYTIHGIWGNKLYVDVAPYDAFMHTLTASLVVDNPSIADDRASANVLIWVGGDVFPTTRGWADLNYQNLPAFAASRLVRVTNTATQVHAANLSNARQDYSGPNSSITIESFRQFPPPL